MALMERHPEDLKLNVLLLLLRHPEGIELRSFSGAFYQLYGCHPNLSLNGYKSLKQLLTEMKDLVIVEGRSHRPVMKLTKYFLSSCGLEEENGSYRLQDYLRCLINKEEAEQQSALSDVLEALRNLLGKYKCGLRIQRVQEFLLASDGVDLETFSVNQGYKDALEFLEEKMPQLKICYRTNRLKCVVQLTADVCNSSASSSIQNQVEEFTSQPPDACNPAPSLDSDFSSYSSNPTSSGLTMQNSGTSSPAPCEDASFPSCNTDVASYHLMGKMSVALANVLAEVTSLLLKSQSGMKIKTLQKFLRTRIGIDLEKFSIGHGYKDTLEFLEAQMPELTIRYHEKRRKSVLQLTADAYSPAPSLDSDFYAGSSDTTSLGPKRQESDTISASADMNCLEEHARPILGFGDNTKSSNPFCDDSASKPHDQSLPAPAASMSPAVDTGLCTMPRSPSFEKACSNSSPKVLDSSERLCPVPVHQPSEDPSSQDLELKQQVAHVLAAHPEGMSLFQFRSTYSAMYQQYLPLGKASSVKQRLLEMPDVVHLKGCGVQTLVLPVSSALSVKTGQAVSSTEDKTSMALGRTSPPATTGTEPAMALKPNPVSLAPEMPQLCPIPPQAPEHKMPDVRELCTLPGEETPKDPEPTNPWQGHQRARSCAEDTSGPLDLFGVRAAKVEPGPPSPPTSLPATQTTAAMARPLPHPPILQKPPTPAECTQWYVRTSLWPAYTPFPPQPFAVSPTDSQAVRLNEYSKPSGLYPKPTFLTNPWRPHNITPVPSAFQQAPANFELWAQSIPYQPITLPPAVPNNSSIDPTPFFPALGNPCGIQLPETALQGHLYVPETAPIKLAQMTSPTHRTEQWSSNQPVLQTNTSSQMEMPLRTLLLSAFLSSKGDPLVSSPSQNTASFRSPRSKIGRQVKCSSYYSLQDGQQGVSLPVSEEELMDGALDGVTPELSSFREPGQCKDADSLVTSLRTLSCSPPPSVPSLLPYYTSSNLRERSDSPLEPLVFRNQPQLTGRNTAPLTSETRPSETRPLCSSFLEPTASPHHQPLHPLSITTNSAPELLSSEPQSLVRCQSYTCASAAVTTPAPCPPNSPLHSVVSTITSFHQPSNGPSGIGVDFNISDEMDASPTVFKQADSSSVPLPSKKTYDSSQGRCPHRSDDRCVLL